MSRDEGLPNRFQRMKAVVDEAHKKRDEVQRLRETERARRSGRKPLDASAIATAAVAIADAQGLEEVSMRKIASVLGWGTMSLYHYVRTKEDLLAAMDDLVMGEILLSPHELRGGWRSAITAIAHHTRDAFRRHPWALTIRTAGGQPGINGMRHVEQSLAALKSTGLSFENKLAVIVIVDDFVFGHALRASSPDFADAQTESAMGEIAEYMAMHLDPNEYPALMDEIGDTPIPDFVRRLTHGFRPDEWFDAGLDSILDGLAKRFGVNGS